MKEIKESQIEKNIKKNASYQVTRITVLNRFLKKICLNDSEEMETIEKYFINRKNNLHHFIGRQFEKKRNTRFGTIASKSIWYGAFDIETCIREAAYYQFLFFKLAGQGIYRNRPRLFHSFTVKINSLKSMDVSSSFPQLKKEIHCPSSHKYSQGLGDRLREYVDTILFNSVRGNGQNIAVFTPDVFDNKSVEKTPVMVWDMQIYSEKIVFNLTSTASDNVSYSFTEKDFYVEGKFPVF